MGRALFSRWLDGPHAPAKPQQRGVHLGGAFASWHALEQRARAFSRTLHPGASYVVDPRAGLDAFVALLAVGQTPNTTLLWANPNLVGSSVTPLGPGLFRCDPPARAPSLRPAYATATSGTSGTAKLPVGHGEQLELVALQYDLALYQTAFDGNLEVNVLATCLPLEYAAVFMMVIVPAMFMARDLVVFDNHRWDVLRTLAARERVACLTVPALVAAANAATPEPVDMKNAALIFTAGHLSRSRSDTVRSKFHGVTLLGSYGASETGVMTLDRAPGESTHVGTPIAGKPVWIASPDEHGIGKIATTGPDCRDHYWGQGERLRDEHGVVAATDYGHFDDEGNLHLDGRVDGSEKFHGLLIHTRRIERHILALPGVDDVRVRVEHAPQFERLKAVVVGTTSVEAVREHCQSLPDSLRPAFIECTSDETGIYSARGKL